MMALPDWLISTLRVMPALLWVYIGLGLPWALVALPRHDWRQRVTMLGLGYAFGPMLLTMWMLLLGTVSLLRLELILIGVVVMTLCGAALAWRKRHAPTAVSIKNVPLSTDEKLLIALIIVAVIIRWFSIAFWPFTAYDSLWVFGYEGRLYTLLNAIPNHIAYYPQFMPLQYSFAQLLVGGIDDHAARAVIWFTHIGSILATWMLGERLFNRRVAIIAAALWALYPHVGEWARFGDLEIPVTFLFTAAAAFFLKAWTQTANRRRYAVIAGLLLGGAMWTKPTAGAFIWGVLLLLAIELGRVRLNWQAWRPRFEVAFFTGIASLPLGAVWYIRNLALGHNAIDLPSSFWLTQAARSGAEFGWPLLALLALLALVYFGATSNKPALRGGIIGLMLVLAGLLPSIIDPHRMGLIEWVLLITGAALLYHTLRPVLRTDNTLYAILSKVGWGLALALPYFVTWFYSYSYHYRLSFPIVPLLLLPTAAIMGYWLTAARIRVWSKPAQVAYGAAIVALALPGSLVTLYDGATGWDGLWRGELTDDFAKYESGNPALMWVVDGLQKYIEEHPDDPLVVAAPGVDRLPFFFPLADIRVDDAPTSFSQLHGVTYFVDSSPEGRGQYENVSLLENQVIAGLSQADESQNNLARRAWWKDDGIFSYTVYELHLDKRFEDPHMFHDPAAPVVFGNFARFRGHGIGADTFWPGRPVYLQLYWEALAQAPDDYMIYVHLRDADGNVQATWDGPVTNSDDGRYYSTLLWDIGEFVRDQRLLRFNEETLPPIGEGYRIVIGMYDLESGERLPVTLDGEPAGDGFTLNERLKVIAEEP